MSWAQVTVPTPRGGAAVVHIRVCQTAAFERYVQAAALDDTAPGARSATLATGAVQRAAQPPISGAHTPSSNLGGRFLADGSGGDVWEAKLDASDTGHGCTRYTVQQG